MEMHIYLYYTLIQINKKIKRKKNGRERGRMPEGFPRSGKRKEPESRLLRKPGMKRHKNSMRRFLQKKKHEENVTGKAIKNPTGKERRKPERLRKQRKPVTRKP